MEKTVRSHSFKVFKVNSDSASSKYPFLVRGLSPWNSWKIRKLSWSRVLDKGVVTNGEESPVK